LDDAGLAVAARDGDRDAFMWLVRGHQARVRALAYGMLGDRALAEDVAQEAFLRAWRGIAGFRGDAAFSTWIYSIARRVALEFARKRTVATVPLDLAPHTADPSGTDPELRGDLERAIAALEPAHREAFLLVAVLGLPYSEVSRMIGVPTGTVASRVFRARERLAEAMRVREEVREEGGAR
jgi:RNA polymerase sigma-70 factor (ECF subfamily)